MEDNLSEAIIEPSEYATNTAGYEGLYGLAYELVLPC